MSKAAFRWEILPIKMRNRRDVIFSLTDAICSFGGAATLLLGVNFLQFAVIFFKLIELFIRLLRQNH